jgi:hypothetical protein
MNYRERFAAPVGINSLLLRLQPAVPGAHQVRDGSVGSSNLQAQGRMDNYLQWWLKDSTLVGSFDLTANKFDLNELMGPSTPEDGTCSRPLRIPAP